MQAAWGVIEIQQKGSKIFVLINNNRFFCLFFIAALFRMIREDALLDHHHLGFWVSVSLIPLWPLSHHPHQPPHEIWSIFHRFLFFFFFFLISKFLKSQNCYPGGPRDQPGEGRWGGLGPTVRVWSSAMLERGRKRRVEEMGPPPMQSGSPRAFVVREAVGVGPRFPRARRYVCTCVHASLYSFAANAEAT